MRSLPPTPPPGPILGLSIKDDANYRYRIVTPLRAIRGATWATYESVTQEQLERASTVVINRMAGPIENMRKMFVSLREQWHIETILIDYDDTWLAPHKVKRVRPKPSTIEGVQYALAHCDGVIVCNEDSRSHYAEYTTKPIAIVPNLVWPNDWEAPAVRQGQPPVITIAGSPSHRYDWDQVVPALIALRTQLPHVALRVLGCPHPTIMKLRTEGREWTHDLAEYVELLKGTTIALCPLEDTLFNRCKGAAKPVEYNLSSGCAVIGSHVQYADLLSEQRGIVIKSSDDPWAWARAIDFYLCNEQQRWSDAARLRDHIVDTLHAGAWGNTLANIYDRELSTWLH